MGMHKIPPLFWLAVFCAILGGGIWSWSSRLPEAVWESSTATALPLPTPSAAPAITPDATPISTPDAKPAPVVEATPSPQPVAPDAAPVASPAPAPASSPDSSAEAAVSPAPSPVPAPAPSPAEMTVTAPTPAPAAVEPVATATPQPTPPPPLTVEDIARQPQLWPKQLLLLTSARFPVVLNGVNVGNVLVPAGSAVILRKVNPEGTVEIELRGSKATVKAEATDLAARARVLAATPPTLPP